MKKITIFIAFILISLTINAQQILQEEGFSLTATPLGWTANGGSNCDWKFGFTGEMPASGTTKAKFPSGAALFDDFICGALSNNEAFLTSPEIDLSDVNSAEIEVVYNLQTITSFRKGEFEVQVFDGTEWKRVFFQDTDTPRDTGENQTATFDVSAYLNAAFKVKFIYDDENFLSWGLGIDNFKLSNTSIAGLDELSLKGFSYYPNPTNGIVNLSANEKIDKIRVFNVIGQEVIRESPSNFDTKIDMNNLPTGTYFVNVQVANKVGTFKMLKV